MTLPATHGPFDPTDVSVADLYGAQETCARAALSYRRPESRSGKYSPKSDRLFKAWVRAAKHSDGLIAKHLAQQVDKTSRGGC